MKEYLNAVIVTVIVCQTAQMMTHDTESCKRFIRMICAAVMLLTIAAPVRYVTANIDRFIMMAEEWTMQEESAESDDPMEQTAQAIMQHACDLCSLDSDGMRITLVTDEEGTIVEIQLFAERCSYSDRVSAEEKLRKIYGIPVYIYSKRE
ncbi:MAG: hypothetical protein IJF78_06505 [Clostridia bacterium]|nr:hypothetical protein [Clostridia bacterium]